VELAENGLSETEAHERLAQYGYNEIRQEPPSLWRNILEKFWGPIPWTLEIALVLELLFGKVIEPTIIGALLIFSALFGGVQKHKTQKALDFLRSRLQVAARVCRDGSWRQVFARELVPGDLIEVKIGDIVPADCQLREGVVEVDQSALTGESLSVSRAIGEALYAGSTIRHGDAVGIVTSTGAQSYFGRTADLIRTVRPAGHLEQLLFAVVRYLVVINITLGILLIGAIFWQGMEVMPLIPFFLVLVTAIMPITMPSAFTMANAIEAKALAKEGVLVTGLSAVQEAATMDVLCVDKTGTLTENSQAIETIVSISGESEEQILALAGTTCDETSQDPIDCALIAACRQRSLSPLPRYILVPFDPVKKYAESYVQQEGQSVRIIVGSPSVIGELTQPHLELGERVKQLAEDGARVLAVAAGPDGKLSLRALIAFADRPRKDAAALIKALRALGIRILMVTGDTLATARAIGRAIGLGDRFADLRSALEEPLRYDGFANCYPEDKLRLVMRLQHSGHVGMTGDGINDAPALKAAEVGIAVSTATDVARASAQVILTQPGLQNIVSIVSGGRRVYRRMLTWTITKIARTVELAALLTLGFIATGIFIAPLLSLALITVINDIVTMTLATDRAHISPTPDQWNMKEIVMIANLFALGWIILGCALLWAALHLIHFSIPQTQTLMFAYLIYSAQITTYMARVRHHFWSFAPSRLLACATIGNVIVASALSFWGVFMEPIPGAVLAVTLGLVLITACLLDTVKVRLYR